MREIREEVERRQAAGMPDASVSAVCREWMEHGKGRFMERASAVVVVFTTSAVVFLHLLLAVTP